MSFKLFTVECTSIFIKMLRSLKKRVVPWYLWKKFATAFSGPRSRWFFKLFLILFIRYVSTRLHPRWHIHQKNTNPIYAKQIATRPPKMRPLNWKPKSSAEKCENPGLDMFASYMENQSVRLPVGDKLTALFALSHVRRCHLLAFPSSKKKRSLQNAYKSPRTIRAGICPRLVSRSWPHISQNTHTHTHVSIHLSTGITRRKLKMSITE